MADWNDKVLPCVDPIQRVNDAAMSGSEAFGIPEDQFHRLEANMRRRLLCAV